MRIALKILLVGATFQLYACKKKAQEAEPPGPKIADPDDNILDPEFPTGVSFTGSKGCVEAVNSAEAKFPQKLSATGCFSDLSTRVPVSGALSFTVRNAFHTGVALKERWLLLPPGAKLTMHPTSVWTMPIGTVALKNFAVEGQPLETRILKRTATGLRAASYKWALDGSDADWVTESQWESVAGMEWLFPSESDCVQCHTPASGEFLGWETRQLNTRHDMLDFGHPYNQISTLSKLGLLEGSPELPAPQQRFVKLDDSLADLTSVDIRARTWIHLNCAYCHMPESSGNGELDLRFDTKLADMKICDVDDQHGDLGVPESKVLVPGKPELSNFYLRMINQDISVTMPLYSTMPPSLAGAGLVKNWISSLTDCTTAGAASSGTQTD